MTSETYFYVCGACVFCRAGHPNLCPSRRSIGSGADGALARYVLVPAINVHRAAARASTTLAGALTEPLACCVPRARVHARRAGRCGRRLGTGAIGLLAAQVLKAAGATVVVLGTAADAGGWSWRARSAPTWRLTSAPPTRGRPSLR